MAEVIAAIIGAVLTGIVHKFVSKNEKSFTERIDSNLFEVYSDQEAPDEIWKGFVRDFKSYNDPWIMEAKDPEEYLNAHVERYSDPNCGEFKFLFFVSENYTSSKWDAFLRFVKFQAMVHFGLDLRQFEIEEHLKILDSKISSIPETMDHVSVYFSFDKSPTQTFFRGYNEKKDDPGKLEKVSIWYLHLGSTTDEPHLILRSTDGRFWNELDRTWNKARRSSVKFTGKEIFLKYLEVEKFRLKEKN